MSLSDKIIFNAELPTPLMFVGKLLDIDDVREAVRELKKRIKDEFFEKTPSFTPDVEDLWEYIDEIFGDKLI